MFTVNMKMDKGAKTFLETDFKKIMSEILTEVGRELIRIIKMDGFAPEGEGDGKGKLKKGHKLVSKSLMAKQIINNVDYWVYVVYGHKLWVSEKQRKWWFWYLREMLGGSYTRKWFSIKKSGDMEVFVMPNNYPDRAVDYFIKSGKINQIVMKVIKRRYGG